MAKLPFSELLKTPSDYLYIFAANEYLARLSARRRTVIAAKKVIQVKFVNTVAVDNNLTYQQAAAKISDAIVDIYGLTPGEILIKLALGENVAGKNWSAGVYGVGATKSNTFVQNSSISVDGLTGKILQDGKEVPNQTPVYDTYKGETYITGYSATVNDVAYSSLIDKSAYKKGNSIYYSNTVGTTNGIQYANGTAFDTSEGSSIWDNILAEIPFFGKLIQWIISLFKIDVINPVDAAPAQMEYLDTEPDYASIGILAAAAIAVLFFSTDTNGGKKKSRKK